MVNAEPTIGPYTLVRSLGRGGFGEVWLAERRSSLLTTRVALKLPILADADIEQIRQEAQVWLQASGHPNIVPVLDAEVYDGQVAIASEYIAGGTLAAWLEKHGGQAPSVEAAAAKAVGILSGLDYLHRSGVIHRDLKPDNVLLQDGAPRLTDFGLARFHHAVDSSENIAGTPHYMAPESFSGTFSPASDLWSVGVILYEMLTGSLPFQQEDILHLITAVQSLNPAPLSAYVPETLRHLAMRLLARAPSDRFASAADALAELQPANGPRGSIKLQISSFPAPKPNHNLPAQPSSFIGRESERTQIRELLNTSHLLTMTGAGGCGKSRLMLQAAEEALPRFEEGVWLVELAPLTDPTLVAQTVANALDITEARGQPLIQTLTAALRAKTMLLLLDNCEHLLDAVAQLADALMRTCPGVRLLATSREPLNLAGEQTYRVPSLSLPSPGHAATPQSLLQFEGVRLFVDRARASSPDFAVTADNAAVVASVCRRLDGIPLAIELAAARTRSLTVEQISHKLDDRFHLLTGGSRSSLPRQQTLRALIDWSYSLLTEPERMLLRRLSVFAGGWTLEAAETVCSGAGCRKSDVAASFSSATSPQGPWTAEEATGSEGAFPTPLIEEWEILDLLTALSDKSLLVSERCGRETRYRLLETVRQYAADRLAERGEQPPLRAAHRNFYLALAEQAEPHFTRPEQGEWLARLEMEHDNLRAALSWCLVEENGVEPGLRIGGALWRFWHNFGYLREGREHLTKALARSDDSTRTLARAKSLNGCGLLNWCQGENDAAQCLYENSLAIGRELGASITVAGSLLGLGLVFLEREELAEAEATCEDARKLCAEIGDKWGLALALNNLGLLASARGDSNRARTLHEESLAVRREMQDRWGVSMSLSNLGTLTAQEGDLSKARALHKESLTIRREIGDRASIAYSLEGYAGLASLEKQPFRVACLLGAAEALRESMGSAVPPTIRSEHGRLIAEITAGYNERIYHDAWQRGRAMTLEQAIDFALAE